MATPGSATYAILVTRSLCPNDEHTVPITSNYVIASQISFASVNHLHHEADQSLIYFL